MKPLFLILAVAVMCGVAGTAAAGDGGRVSVPASWAKADSADSLWRRARNAIADENWDGAAQLFQRIHERFPQSVYAADSFYWQAFALSRIGGTSTLRRAVTLLETQQEKYAAAETVKSGESKSLSTRLKGKLAQRGDAASAADIATIASGIDVGEITAQAAEIAAQAGEMGARIGEASARAAADAARAGMAAALAARDRRRSSVPGCQSEDDDPRVEALNALMQMDAAQALPILKQVLARRDPCSEILRQKAVFLVSQKRSEESADILMSAARNDPDPETRSQAVFWLSQVSSEKAIDLLQQILQTSSDAELQQKAIDALGQKRDPRAQQLLRDYAARENAPHDVREQAIFWLGQRRSPENAQFLRQLFARTGDDETQQKILFSLSQQRGIGNEDWLLDQALNAKFPMDVRKQALFWAGQSGVDAARLAALYDRGGDTGFRRQVIFVLAQKHSTEATDKLIAIAKTERDSELRKQAIFWLGQSRDPRALKALQELIEK